MKNFLILGLLALLLFSVSASLSLWLNQNRQQTEPTEKAGTKPASRNPDAKDPPAEPRTLAKADLPPPRPADNEPMTSAVLKDREARLERRAAQMDLILKDIQSQRDTVDATLRQITAELKLVSARSAELETLAADLKKKVGEAEVGEAKNIEKMAAVYDTMAAESAAPIIKQMAETGRMETAARVLTRMKERNAAAVLAALADPALSAQLLDKMRGLRPEPPPAGVGGPVAPVRGP